LFTFSLPSLSLSQFFTFWQSVLLAILSKLAVLHETDHYKDSSDLQTALQDFIVCIEMCIAAIAHSYAFSVDDFYDQTRPLIVAPMFRSLFEVLDVSDVYVQDVQRVKKKALGRKKQRLQQQIRAGAGAGNGNDGGGRGGGGGNGGDVSVMIGSEQDVRSLRFPLMDPTSSSSESESEYEQDRIRIEERRIEIVHRDSRPSSSSYFPVAPPLGMSMVNGMLEDAPRSAFALSQKTTVVHGSGAGSISKSLFSSPATLSRPAPNPVLIPFIPTFDSTADGSTDGDSASSLPSNQIHNNTTSSNSVGADGVSISEREEEKMGKDPISFSLSHMTNRSGGGVEMEWMLREQESQEQQQEEQQQHSESQQPPSQEQQSSPDQSDHPSATGNSSIDFHLSMFSSENFSSENPVSNPIASTSDGIMNSSTEESNGVDQQAHSHEHENENEQADADGNQNSIHHEEVEEDRFRDLIQDEDENQDEEEEDQEIKIEAL